MPSKTFSRTISLEIPDDTPEYYSNVAQMFVTQWDFTLIFGATRVFSENGEIQASARSDVLVRMSPQHTKAFVAKLARLVEGYEEANGPLPEILEADEEHQSVTAIAADEVGP